MTVERELGSNTALSVGYVGSVNDRLGITGLWNTAQTPGTGTAAQVRARTPFPWYNTSAFYSTSNGTSNYNALQVKLDRRFSNGFQYLVAYILAQGHRHRRKRVVRRGERAGARRIFHLAKLL